MGCENKRQKAARCTLCRSDISLSNMSSTALDDHARGKKHSEKVKNRETGTALFLQTTKSSTDSSSGKPATVKKKKRNMLEDLIINKNMLNAEIWWTLEIVMSHLSFRSYIDLNKLFISMFPDSEVASKFTCGKTKCAYLINYSTAPHLKNILTKEITEPPFYSLSFDESFNVAIQCCQMDFGICFWDDVNNLV